MKPTFEKESYEEHRGYLHEIVRLQLWFAWWWKREHPEEPFESILRNRTAIYQKTDINRGTMINPKMDFDSPEWIDLKPSHLFTGQYQPGPGSGS